MVDPESDQQCVPIDSRKLDEAMVEMFLNRFSDPESRQKILAAFEIMSELPASPLPNRKRRRS